MLRDRQEILAVGEFAVFLATWIVVVWGAIAHYQHREHLLPGDSVASSRGLESDNSIRE